VPTFLVHLHGVSFLNDDKSSRQTLVARCRSGDRLVLRAEPENPYDRHAVAVLNESGQQLGYLPSDARDSSALLRGEPINACVKGVIGGSSLWNRLFGGAQKSYGLIVQLTKGEPDWTQFGAHRQKAEPVDRAVEKGQVLERKGRIDEAVAQYSRALQAILALNEADPAAAAHRYRPAPVNRLSLLLEKAKRYEEALSTISGWRAVRDPVGLPKGEFEAVTKREARLRKTMSAERR
jgi:tetratricopeptide (TPR) repeat protein